MRTFDVGRIVKLREAVAGLPAGTIGRVLVDERKGGGGVLIQAAPGTRTIDGDIFIGHSGNRSVRKRAWYIGSVASIQGTRDKVANAREFQQRYAQ